MRLLENPVRCFFSLPAEAKRPDFCIFAKFLTLKLEIMAYKISDDCAACGTCMSECPVGAISEGDIFKIDPDMCTECGTCADACPMEAIHLDE